MQLIYHTNINFPSNFLMTELLVLHKFNTKMEKSGENLLLISLKYHNRFNGNDRMVNPAGRCKYTK